MTTRKVLAEFGADGRPMLVALRQIDAGIARFEGNALKSFGRVEKGLSGLVSAASDFRNITGLIASGLGVNLATNFVDSATRIQNALRETGAEFNDVYLAATRSLAGFENFAQSVRRFQAVLGQRGQTVGQTIRQLETLNKLLALSGKTTQERGSTMLQFSQALQAGVLQGEELRALRENAPIEFMRAIAEEAGGTIESLKKLGEQGLLTTDVMVRALNRMEKEADARFKNVQLTIADAAVALQNGAIVATKGFDEGSGLSRAAVAGLKTLGDVLGQSAEAAEMLGAALKYAFLIGGTVWVSGKVGNAIRDTGAALTEGAAAARQALTAATALEAKEAQSLVTSAMALRAAEQRVVALRSEGASKRQLTSAIRIYDRAVVANSAALGRYREATDAVAAANARLSASSRAAAGAAAMIRSAWDFIGGLPGAILLVGSAAFAVSQMVESSAERLARLTDNTDNARDAVDSLVEVQARLKEAMEAAGDASDQASQRILANTQAEYEAKKKVLALDTQALGTKQNERVVDTVARQDRINSMLRSIEQLNAMIATDRTLGDRGRQEMRNEIARIQADVEAEETAIVRLRAAYEETAAVITKNLELLDQTFSGIDPKILPEAEAAKIEAAMERIRQVAESTMTTEERHAATLRELADARQVLVDAIAKTGDANGTLAASLEQVDGAMARVQGEMSKTTGEANTLTGAARTLAGVLAGLGSMRIDMSGSLAGAKSTLAGLNARVNALRSGASRPVAAGEGFVAQTNATLRGAGVDEGFVRALQPQIQQLRSMAEEAEAVAVATEAANAQLSDLLSPDVGGGADGGGGGGAAAAVSELEQEALRFIESMMTAEERRAKQLQEMLALRKEIVETYGPESALVAQMDVGIQRLQEGMDEVKSSTAEWEDLLVGALTGSVDLADTLKTKIIDAAAQWALFNKGPWARGNGGGLLGGVLPFLGNLFANGGVMTASGPLPLRTYSRGGIARSPQVAIYGEGKTPEAYVPLPDGRSIPVNLAMKDFGKMPGGTAPVQYVEVPYVARVDADDKGRLVARIERVREEAMLGDMQVAQGARRGLPAALTDYQGRGTTT